MARKLHQLEKGDLIAAVSQAHNGRRLLAVPELCEDVSVCLQRDRFDLASGLSPRTTVVRL
jgi:phosphosulfolactate phosphohydrolase-like enzyme